MRIVHHFTEIKTAGGGVPRAVLDLAHGLSRAGEEVILLTATGSNLDHAGASEGAGRLDVVELDPVSRPAELLTRAGRRRVLAALASADVMHLHGLWRPRNSQIARWARLAGRPYVLSPHGMLGDWATSQRRWIKALYYRLFERRNLGEARHVLFASQRELEQATPWLPHARRRVIPLAVDLTAYEHLPGGQLFGDRHPEIEGEDPIVLLLSRLHPGKRADLLIEAVATLHRSGVTCRLLVAGEGEPAYVRGLRTLAREHGIAERVHFLGLVTGREKSSLYQRANLTVLPTVGESFGLALVESLACGTPVVTTRGTDTWSEILESGGCRITEANAGALASCIAELLADPGLRSRMGSQGRKWVFEWLDPESVIPQYQSMYHDAVGI